MPITKYELLTAPDLEEEMNSYQQKIDDEFKSSSRQIETIIYWQLCIIEIRFELLSRRI